MKPGLVAALAAGVLFGTALLARAKPDKDFAGRLAHRPEPPPSASAPGRGPGSHGSQGDLAEMFRHHRPKPEEAKARIAEFRQTFAARREAHRELVRTEFGGAALSHPGLIAELKKHARHLAFLDRAKLVATTELAEPKRSATLARIDQLTAREEARHTAAIQKLKGEPAPTPSALAAASSAPAVSSATPTTTGHAP